ncbi:MAG: hypothetical protein MUP14_04235 [Dehalococcoidia bacterium]|nr:hypothetical protein [Dehalococcoidia bacterium]
MSESGPSRFNLLQGSYAAFGLAAGTLLTVTIPPGERWKILHALASHDDNGGPHNLHWIVTRSGVSYILHEVVAVAVSIRMQMYQYVYFSEPLVLRPGDLLHIEAEAMGAGKKLYIQLLYEARIGEAA